MARQVQANGKMYEFPDDITDEEVRIILEYDNQPSMTGVPEQIQEQDRLKSGKPLKKPTLEDLLKGKHVPSR